MVGMRLAAFAGMVPVKDARSLPDSGALDALDFWPDASGTLHGVGAPAPITGLKASTRAVYRIPVGDVNDLAASFWMQFDDPDTDVARTPNVNDGFKRYYWASPSTGLLYDTEASILAGGTPKKVGIVPPASAPIVGVVSGTGAITDGKNTGPRVTREYVATFISIYGEESQPGPASEAEGASDQDWEIQQIPVPPVDAARSGVATVRIYRTVTDASYQVSFVKVVDLPAGTTYYLDRLTDLQLTQTGLESTAWSPPPDGLQGIRAMPNGILAGFTGNTLHFSENYRPHAWPDIYRIAVEHPIVGLGLQNGELIVLTTGRPVRVSGLKSAQMAQNVIGEALPCLSRGGIVSAAEGVYYPTSSGIMLIGPGGVARVTDNLIGRDAWTRDYTPAQLRGAMVEGALVLARPGLGAFAFRPQAQEAGLVRLTTPGASPYVQPEPWSGKALIIANGTLYQFLPAGTLTGAYLWRSKEFQTARPVNMAVAQVSFDKAAGTTVRIRVWAWLRGARGATLTEERQLVFDQEVGDQPGREIRLPSGYLADIWQVEVAANARVHRILLASTVADLRNA
jgi:hypothetical protein